MRALPLKTLPKLDSLSPDRVTSLIATDTDILKDERKYADISVKAAFIKVTDFQEKEGVPLPKLFQMHRSSPSIFPSSQHFLFILFYHLFATTELKVRTPISAKNCNIVTNRSRVSTRSILMHIQKMAPPCTLGPSAQHDVLDALEGDNNSSIIFLQLVTSLEPATLWLRKSAPSNSAMILVNNSVVITLFKKKKLWNGYYTNLSSLTILYLDIF